MTTRVLIRWILLFASIWLSMIDFVFVPYCFEGGIWRK
jgi:hypothetical protein